MQDDIQIWLSEEGFFRQKVSDENSNFHFIINFPENHVMDVIQPKGKDDMIIIGCATNISQEHLDKMKILDSDEREKFIWKFRFSLNSLLVDFQLVYPDNIIQSYVITEEIYKDGLTKDRLMSSIKNVFRAKLQGLWEIQSKFGEDENNTNNSDTMFV